MIFAVNIPRCLVGVSVLLLGWGLITFLGNLAPDAKGDANRYAAAYRAFKEGKCKSCHPAIWREWEKSMHAQAWIDEIYQEAAKQISDRETSCDPCHAPEPILVTGIGNMPKLRNVQREAGVSCLVCHMDANGAMHGPRASAETYFHVNVTDTAYTEPTTLCSTCHGQPSVPEHDQVSSFQRSSFAAEKKSCATCHMPPVKRLQSTASYKSIKGRKHTWPGSRSVAQLKRAATLKIERVGEKATVTFQNKTGHVLPGDALRIIVLDVTHLAPNGSTRQQKKIAISAKNENRLQPGENRVFVFEVGAGDTLKARLRYQLTAKTPESAWIRMAEASYIVP